MEKEKIDDLRLSFLNMRELARTDLAITMLVKEDSVSFFSAEAVKANLDASDVEEGDDSRAAQPHAEIERRNNASLPKVSDQPYYFQ